MRGLHDASTSTRGRRVRVVVAVALLVSVAAAPATWSTTGVSPGTRPDRVIDFDVRTRGDVRADVGVFTRIAQQTFNDRRGWSLGGTLRYRHVRSGGDFTLWLASPSEVRRWAPVCSKEYSCTVGNDVIINDERWRRGTSTWPDVREYRPYLLSHELGHWLGLGHRSCPGSGQYAPVMQQQSISLEGCTTNTWPLESERNEAARRMGVGVLTQRPELYAIAQQGRTGTEVHALGGGSDYRDFTMHSQTRLHETAPDGWTFIAADHDRGGVDDLFVIKHRGGSGRTEVHVLNGDSGYRTYQLQVATPLHQTSAADWSFDVADTNGDGHLDVVAVKHLGASGRTEVHVLDGADSYRSWLRHTPTPLHRTDPAEWEIAMGDHDRDGWPDVYAIDRRGSSGRVEVHVLDGEGGWQRWLRHAVTPLHPVYDEWELMVEDVQGDGYATVVALDRHGGSGRTEVHVLDDFQYDRWHLNTATGLHPTTSPTWRFSLD